MPNWKSLQSLNKYQYGYNNPLRYVDPDGHQGQGNKTITQRIKEGAQQAYDTARKTVNGVVSTVAENNGIIDEPFDAEQNAAGRVIGHGLSILQSGVEMSTGLGMMAAGASETVVTSPACATGAGCVLPAAGVGTVAAGGAITIHGAAVGVNTLNNIFNKTMQIAPGKTSHQEVSNR